MDHSQVELYPAAMRDNLRTLLRVARSYRDDAEFRRRAASEPRAALAGMGLEIEPPEMEVRVCANTEDTVYVAMPPDPNVVLRDDQSNVVGGSTASTGGSAGTATTMSSVPSTISSASSASTLASAGTVGRDG